MILDGWSDRSIEEAHLLNPAFCCTMLNSFIFGYSNIHSDGLPYPIIYMILPIVLHKSTRETLPKNTKKSLASWLHQNQKVRIQFYERLIALKPYTQEALIFGFTYDWFELHPKGKLTSKFNESQIKKMINSMSEEARECVLRARFIGKWFARAGSVPTLMYLWGVTP